MLGVYFLFGVDDVLLQQLLGQGLHCAVLSFKALQLKKKEKED